MNRVILVIVFILSFLTTGCFENDPKIKTKYKQVGYFEGSRPDAQQYFVYVDLTSIDNSRALEDLKNIAGKLCENAKWCTVHYWDELENTAHTIPMTDTQADSKIASYTINTFNGHNEFGCHPFGDEGKQCV